MIVLVGRDADREPLAFAVAESGHDGGPASDRRE
jgi:hypothetical protein